MPAAMAAQPERAPAPERPSPAPRWSEVAARAQSWTVAVRADQSYGAGVAVDRAGLVLTNLHVVDAAKAITVTPFGADPISAEVLDIDRELDIALLRLPSPLPNAASMGRSDTLGVGDEVMAVGSPRKMYFSVSRGLVSFPNRFLDGVEYIQTDLPINVGNSGGPLVDDEGDVVGIVSFILRDSQGISFALPIDRAVTRFGEHLTRGPGRGRGATAASSALTSAGAAEAPATKRAAAAR
jgi:S1-C subfamily serine protease